MLCLPPRHMAIVSATSNSAGARFAIVEARSLQHIKLDRSMCLHPASRWEVDSTTFGSLGLMLLICPVASNC